MEYSLFELQVAEVVPHVIYKQFRSVLPYIPQRLRPRFLKMIRKGSDFGYAVLTMVSKRVNKNQALTELYHQRMQDNMSEIMD